jgi:hypothetical protein
MEVPMKHSFRLLALTALLLSCRAFAYDDLGCPTVVWSPEHGHYHCVEDRSYEEVRYYDSRPVSAPRVYVGLSVNSYPRYWGHGPRWGVGFATPWYYGPSFYAARPFYYRPYRAYYPYHHRHWR